MNTTIECKGEKISLKLTLGAAIKLEEELGKNPLMIFAAAMPLIKDVCQVLICAGMDEDHIAAWIDEGHSYHDMVTLAADVFRESGLIKESEEKNA